MSSLKKSGRRRKNVNKCGSYMLSTEFNLIRFKSVLKQLGGDPLNWSVKKGWIVFHKTYFNTSSSKIKHARSCYDFYRRHIKRGSLNGEDIPRDNVAGLDPNNHVTSRKVVDPSENTLSLDPEEVILREDINPNNDLITCSEDMYIHMMIQFHVVKTSF